MKTNFKIVQKILITLFVVILLFNFITPIKVKAVTDEEGIGGALFSPIQKFITFLGDSVIWLMQSAFLGDDSSITAEIGINGTVDAPWWFDALTVAIPGLWVDIGGGYEVNDGIYTTLFGGNTLDLPNIRISPESIFSNKILAFDINFFDPKPDSKVEKIAESSTSTDRKTYTKEELNEKINSQSSFKEFYNTDLRVNYNEIGYKVIVVHDGVQIKLQDFVTDDQYQFTRTTNEDNYKLAQEFVEQIYNYIEGLYSIDTSSGEDEEIIIKSSASILQSTVSYWYNLLRNIAIIGLLSVLVYIGIRIVISSAASDKSKYKEMLKDWLVALCLLFFMHYLMSFIVTATSSIAEALNTNNSDNVVNTTIVHSGMADTEVKYPGDALIGNARIQLQSGNFWKKMSYTIIYAVLVVYTVIFAIMYLKRVIYMAFFTMIAPLVALTYPLDKIRDGKAQAFDFWLREYTFNALIQPFHLIIYYIVVGSALDLATTNPIYALAAIGFMLPAEKILRKFFGFDKASTAGALGGMLSGALLMQGVNKLSNRLGHSGGKGKASGGEGKDNKPIRSSDRTTDVGKNKRDLLGFAAISGESSSEGQEDDSSQKEQRRHDMRTADEAEESKGNNSRQSTSGFVDSDGTFYNPQEDMDVNIKQASLTNGAGFRDENGEYYDPQEDMLDEDDIKEDKSKISSGDRARVKALIGARYLGRAAKFTGKGILKAYGAATVGTIGVAAGLASEDYSNVAKWGIGGAVAGNIAAKAAINKVGKLPSSVYRMKSNYESTRDAVEEQELTKEQRKALRNERADKAFMKDKQAIKKYKDAFKENYEARMEDAKQYRAYGITNDDAIIKAMKLKTLGEGNYTDNLRMIVAGYADRYSNIKEINTFKDDLKEKKYGKRADDIARALREYHDI